MKTLLLAIGGGVVGFVFGGPVGAAAGAGAGVVLGMMGGKDEEKGPEATQQYGGWTIMKAAKPLAYDQLDKITKWSKPRATFTINATSLNGDFQTATFHGPVVKFFLAQGDKPTDVRYWEVIQEEMLTATLTPGSKTMTPPMGTRWLLTDAEIESASNGG